MCQKATIPTCALRGGFGTIRIMRTMERTFTLDRDLARRADRKLHRYGMSLDDAVAHTLVFIVSKRGNPLQGAAVPPVIEFDAQGQHFVADVKPDGDSYSAQVRDCPECFTCGDNLAELRKNLVEVTKLMYFDMGEVTRNPDGSELS